MKDSGGQHSAPLEDPSPCVNLSLHLIISSAFGKIRNLSGSAFCLKRVCSDRSLILKVSLLTPRELGNGAIGVLSQALWSFWLSRVSNDMGSGRFLNFGEDSGSVPFGVFHGFLCSVNEVPSTNA